MRSKAKTTIKCTALVIGVVIIPLLYSFFYLRAFWDPYNMLDRLPVAIVNKDKGAEINGENRNLGSEVTERLKKDGSLKFVVTNETDAKNGVNGSKYYAVITLPSDFSQRISTASSTNKKEGIIQYEVNQKHNYIASQILKNAINQIEEKTRGSVDEEIVSNLTDKVKEVPDKLGELNDGIDKLKNGSGELADGTKKAADGQKTLNSGINDLNSGLSKLYSGSTALSSGQKTLNSGIVSLSSGLGRLHSGSTDLLGGLKTLDNGLGTAMSGVGQLSSAISSQNGMQSLVSGVKQLNDGANQLLSQFSTSGSSDPSKYTIFDAVNAINQGNQALLSQFSSSNDAKNPTIYDGVTQVDAGAQQLASQAPTYISLVNNSIYTMITTDKSASQTILNKYNSQISALQAAYASATDQTTKAKYYEQLTVLANLATMYSVGLNAPDEATFETQLNALAKNDATKQSVVSAGSTLGSGINTLASGTKSLSSQFKDGGKLKSSVALLASSTQKFASQFSDGGSFKTGVAALAKGTQQLYNGVGSLGKLTSSIDAFTNGMKQLKDGSSQLVGGAYQLENGLSSAYSGSTALVSGSAQLADGSDKLQTGLSTACSGTVKLSDGSNQLVSASDAINSGASQLNDGISTAKNRVSDSINDANDQLGATNNLSSYAKTPVSVKTTELNAIPNYGSAFAPYFMSLSLWVGGLLIFFGIYLDADERIKVLSRHSENKLLRVLAFALIGVAQALALAIIVQFALGLSISNIPAFYASCIIVSIVFISIIEFLIVNFGDIGKFLALAFLVLQLTSNGGTFPMETVPKFFNALYPFMPMTYSVKLFKECTSNFNAANAWGNIGILLGIFAVFTGLTIVFSLSKKVKNKIGEKIQSQN